MKGWKLNRLMVFCEFSKSQRIRLRRQARLWWDGCWSYRNAGRKQSRELAFKFFSKNNVSLYSTKNDSLL